MAESLNEEGRYYVASFTIDQIDDQRCLRHVVENARLDAISEKAFKKLYDEEELAIIATNDINGDYGRRSLDKMYADR